MTATGSSARIAGHQPYSMYNLIVRILCRTTNGDRPRWCSRFDSTCKDIALAHCANTCALNSALCQRRGRLLKSVMVSVQYVDTIVAAQAALLKGGLAGRLPICEGKKRCSPLYTVNPQKYEAHVATHNLWSERSNGPAAVFGFIEYWRTGSGA